MSFRDVRITVLKKVETGEVFKEHAVEGARASCPMVGVGEDYVSKNAGMPAGFCSWAWADIHWIREEGVMVSCCTDGLRPVIFKLERI